MDKIVQATPHEVKKALDNGEITLVDVREAHEYAEEHIPCAKHFPLSSFDPDEVQKKALAGAICFQCRSGVRSQEAALMLQSSGENRPIWNLSGGILAWKEAEFPTQGM